MAMAFGVPVEPDVSVIRAMVSPPGETKLVDGRAVAFGPAKVGQNDGEIGPVADEDGRVGDDGIHTQAGGQVEIGDRQGGHAHAGERERDGRVKDVVLDLDGHGLAGADPDAERAPADVVDEPRQARIADEIEGRSWRAERGGRRILPTLEENRLDNVH
jgi:hypothetical protein